MFATPDEDSSAPEHYDEQWAMSETHPTFIYRHGQFVVRHPEKIRANLKRIERFRKLNRLLDVGCSAAFFLKLAHDAGWNVKGVEVSDFGVRYSRDVLKLDVFQGLLHEAAFPPESFDVICHSHVLEHISQPRAFLREIHRILRPGGAMLTVVPTQYAAPGYRLFGNVTGESPPRHVSFFTRLTFNELLTRESFRLADSWQNIELQRLIPRRVEPEPVATEGRLSETEETKREQQSRPANRIVQWIKSGVNAVGSLFDIGDELTAIAIKIDRTSTPT